MNQRTPEDVAVPTPSPLATPDRVGAIPKAAMYRPKPTDRIGAKAVATADTPANGVSGVNIAITSSSITARRRGA